MRSAPPATPCWRRHCPGHGSDPADLVGITWDDWLHAAAEWPADVVIGQSMGANLALALGRRRAHVAQWSRSTRLAADPDAIDGLEWRRITRGHERIDVEPSTVGEQAYDWLPIIALQAMHEGIATVDLTRSPCRR